MDAYQTNLDVIANNLANAGTTGFKESRLNFADLCYQNVQLPGSQDSNGQPVPIGMQVGTASASTAPSSIRPREASSRPTARWTWPFRGKASFKFRIRRPARRSTRGRGTLRSTQMARWC